MESADWNSRVADLEKKGFHEGVTSCMDTDPEACTQGAMAGFNIGIASGKVEGLIDGLSTVCLKMSLEGINTANCKDDLDILKKELEGRIKSGSNQLVDLQDRALEIKAKLIAQKDSVHVTSLCTN